MGVSSTWVRPILGWAIFTLIIITAWPSVFGSAQAQEEGYDDPMVYAENVYAQNCSGCHGGDGLGGDVVGTGRTAPALTGRDDVTAAYVDLVLRTGRMQPAGDPWDNRIRHVAYNDEQREAIVEWMTAEFDLVADVPEVGEGDPTRGLESYALNCAHCHGSTGAGGAAGQRAWTPNLNQHDPVTIVEGIRVGPFEMPQFSEGQISDQEAADIAAFLEEVHAEEGTVLGFAELNPVYASGFVIAMSLFLLGSLWFLGSHPKPIEAIAGDMNENATERGVTPMPGDENYEAMVSAENSQTDVDDKKAEEE